ncbi:MAG: hypothetical protein ACYC96_13350 [Fimbriimonadaceae bacterium]
MTVLAAPDRAFLGMLYERYFTVGLGGTDFVEWGAANGLDRPESLRLFDRLKYDGLVTSASLGPYAKITPRGILAIEEDPGEFSPMFEAQTRVRAKILRRLLQEFDDRGPRASYVNFDSLPFATQEDHVVYASTVYFLRDIGLVEFLSIKMWLYEHLSG